MRNLTAAAAGGCFLAALTSLTGCQTSNEPVMPAGNSSEQAAREACLSAVKAETNNPKAAVASSSFSEAATKVIVVVGDQQAAWECIAYKDGSTSRPVSLTNEGAL